VGEGEIGVRVGVGEGAHAARARMMKGARNFFMEFSVEEKFNRQDAKNKFFLGVLAARL
jgi:hypothetical protein